MCEGSFVVATLQRVTCNVLVSVRDLANIAMHCVHV
jgi:hypothetical protein